MWHLYQTIQIPCHYPRLKTCSQSNNMCNTRSLIQRSSKLTNKKKYNHHRTNQQITRMQVWCSMKHTRWSSVQWKPPGCKLTNKYETFKFWTNVSNLANKTFIHIGTIHWQICICGNLSMPANGPTHNHNNFYTRKFQGDIQGAMRTYLQFFAEAMGKCCNNHGLI